MTGRVVSSSSHATAGESERIRGLRVSGSSLCMSTNSLNQLGVLMLLQVHVCLLCLTASSSASAPASLAVVAHARSTPMHVVHNSCSDTVRVRGPTGTRRCAEGGGSGPSEDFAPYLRGGGRGKFSAGRRCTGAGCRFTSQEGNQAQVPGNKGLVRTHLPCTRRFLTPDPRHLDADWTSGNQWAGRRCVEPHDRGFGC